MLGSGFIEGLREFERAIASAAGSGFGMLFRVKGLRFILLRFRSS